MHAEVVDRTLLVDGTPQVVRAGEIHPFRLHREQWARRLQLLRDAGATAVAAYIPWVVHEQPDGTIDLTGRVRPELDLGAFIDAAVAHGLRFLARPGPFTMGELRHEGVPGRILREHPELRPIGWDGVPAPTSDLDVAAPAFLAEADRWYAALGPVLAPRVASGAVIGVQLDNEIGMLSWVANAPVLTDDLLAELRSRFGGTRPYPAADADIAVWRSAIRTPSAALAPDLRVDLAALHRDRAARYVGALLDSAQRHGFGGVPCYVNVHGTEAGSARSMAIGISQLQRTWRDRPAVVPGSDHYVGSLDFAGAADLHLVHAFLAATAPDRPIAALEHEAGTGDYAGDLQHVVAPEATEQKTRLLLGQGVRLFNWYLFAGGTNFVDPRPEDEAGEGHRFGITGQRHGAAAPVTSEGEPSSAYAPTARAIAAAALPAAAVWQEEHDGLVMGYVPSAFATEHLHPADDAGRELVAELTWGRSGGPDALLPRMLLAAGFRYGAVDLEAATLAELAGRVLVLGTGDVLDGPVQRLLVEHVRDGGGLLLVGDLPVRDLRGRPATDLADALGLRRVEVVRQRLGVRPAVQPADGGAEVNVDRLTHLDRAAGEVLLTDALTGAPCGVEVRQGAGRAIVIAASGPADPAFHRALLARLGATPAFEAEGAAPGLILQTTRTPAGERFLLLLDTLGHGQRVVIRERGRVWFGGDPVQVPPRGGVTLALR